MGNTYSTPPNSPRKSKKSTCNNKLKSTIDYTNQYKEDLSKIQQKTSNEVAKRLNKWNETLTNLIIDPKFDQVKGWKNIKIALCNFIKKYKQNKPTIDWLVNAQYSESKSESYLFGSTFKKPEFLNLSLLINATNNNNETNKGIDHIIERDELVCSTQYISTKTSLIYESDINNMHMLQAISNNDLKKINNSNTNTNNNCKKRSTSPSSTSALSSKSNNQFKRQRQNTKSMIKLLNDMSKKPSAKKELIQHLKNHLCDNGGTHIIWDIIKVFKNEFAKQYIHYLDNINEEALRLNHLKILKEIREIIRIMKKILKKFVKHLYKNKLEQLDNHLQIEDQDINIILNSIAYQLIFDEDNTENGCKCLIYRLIRKLLSIKNEHKLNKFLEISSSLKIKKISEYDELLKRIFWLENDDIPYHRVIKYLSSIHTIACNPYYKFELLSVFEEEILKYLEMYYFRVNTNSAEIYILGNDADNDEAKNNVQKHHENCLKITKNEQFELKEQIELNDKCHQDHSKQDIKMENIIEKFKEPDQKYPILIYCIIQSQNEKLILDVDMISEFVNHKYIEERNPYITFAGILMDYILNGEILTKFIQINHPHDENDGNHLYYPYYHSFKWQ